MSAKKMPKKMDALHHDLALTLRLMLDAKTPEDAEDARASAREALDVHDRWAAMLAREG